MHIDEHISLIEHVTSRPAMWVGKTDYELVTSFLSGYDYALNGGLLAGFHEWLTMRYGRGNNLAWSALIRYETNGYPENDGSNREQDQQLLLDTLRDLLLEFLHHRHTVGLRNVYYDHGKWIRQFDWFDENVERYGCSAGPKTEQLREPEPPSGSN